MRLKRFWLLALTAAIPGWAHHSIAAMYDEKKPLTLKGAVTAYEWNNPHVFIYLEADAGGGAAKWTVELPSRIELKRVGWSRDSIKAGDAITVEASPARDGSKKVW